MNPIDTAAMMTFATLALEQGFRVFPVAAGAKVPAVKSWESRATTDVERIHRCWATGAWNVGIATGPSNLVVVDLDMPKPAKGELFVPDQAKSGVDNFADLCAGQNRAFPSDTFTVTTASGGRHLYFRHPADGPQLRNTAKRLADLVDTRAHGGFVVAAGSVVAGAQYRVTNDVPIAELPAWLAELLTPAPLPVQEPVEVSLPDTRRGAYLNAAITAEARKVAAAAEGERNKALYIAAIALGQLVAGGELTESDVKLVLSQAAAEAGLWLGESARTITSGLRAGANRPRNLAGVGA